MYVSRFLCVYNHDYVNDLFRSHDRQLEELKIYMVKRKLQPLHFVMYIHNDTLLNTYTESATVIASRLHSSFDGAI